jgi:hypothetical protein
VFLKLNSRHRAAASVAIIVMGFTLAGCAEKLSREDFATRIKDKAEQEVRKDIGTPASVDASVPDNVKWTYVERTFNIEKGNTFDKKTIVVFSRAAPGSELKVKDVMFE